MSKKNLYFAVATLAGMLFGYDTAVINGAMPFFTAFFDLSDAMVGWSVSSGLLGCVIGATIASYPADKFGRRDSMKIVAILFLLSALATGLAPNFSIFILGRIIGGVAVGAVSVILPIYISEITPPENRGRSSINFQLGIVLGILVAFFVDYLLIDTGEYNWRYMFLSMALPAITFSIFLAKAKCSPRWLLMKQRTEEARESLAQFYSATEVEKTITDIQNNINSIKADTNTDANSDKPIKKSYLKFIMIGIGVGIFSQLSGIAIVMYYATDIFREAGFSTDAAIGQTVIIGIVNLIFTLIAKSLIDRVGRKKLLLRGILGMVITLSILSLSFFEANLPAWMILVSLVSFVACFASSMGAVSWVLLGEIFPNNIRSKGMAIGSLTNWITNGALSFLFPIVVGISTFGAGYCFAFLAFATLGGYFFFKKYLFETKSKTLEEIENEFSK